LGFLAKMNDKELRKLWLARYLYKNSLILEPTPSSEGKKRMSKGWQTWAMWWTRHHGDDILVYIEKMKEAKK
jgi:hypothetical protein